MYTIRSKDGTLIAHVSDQIGKEIIMKTPGDFEEKHLRLNEWYGVVKCYVLYKGCTYGVGHPGTTNYMNIFVWPKGYIYKGEY